ncbi:threonyl-tRNA synthetase editing domain-containing protein [Natronoarchaeum sp. GCM10025321]|uniref:threonyl-tRNA synthetase editing domain-containing protein n=1 Tax=Natronoarchaeum sp. GCM10025321 TaxID=3252684 RepID=UPI0036206A36
MRLLAVHVESLSSVPVHSRADTEPDEHPERLTVEQCVGAFVGVEASDSARLESVVAAAAEELRAASEQLNTDRIALVPTPHLVDDPADPAIVEDVFDGIAAAVAGLDVQRVPAGWHLELDVRTKGHPYSVRSRRLTGEERAAATACESEWFVVDGGADGGDVLHPMADDTDIPPRLEPIVADGRRGARRGSRVERVLVEQEVAAEDGIAANGELRWNQRGVTMRACVRALLDDQFEGVGATPIRTPESYDPAVKAVREHLAAEGWRTGGETVRRRALCPGHLWAFADTSLDADALPATLWEVGTCTRDGPSGPRTATLPEAHTAVGDIDAALSTVEDRLSLVDALDSTLGLDRVPVVRVTGAFYDQHGTWVDAVVEGLDAPVAVERGAVGSPFTVEFVTDAGDGIVDAGWVRLDVDGPARFGVESRGETPVVVHTAPVGTVEALLAALLGGDAPVPTWLVPTQVRLVPVADRHLDRCRSVAATLAERGVRVDVDDRKRTVGERIDAAGDDFVAQYAIVGDRGDERDELRLTDARDGTTRETTAEDVADRIRSSTPLSRAVPRRGPLLLSERLAIGRIDD